MSVFLSFHGGAGTVTGSRFLIEVDSSRFLVDAGLFQGLKKLREMNWSKLRFDPAHVDFVLLTHAHIDHCGFLPRLWKEGFRGPVFCTRATLDLARLLLLDAAKIQEEDAEYANRMGYSKHRPALPLYTSEDAESAIGLLRPVGYGEWIGPAPEVRVRFQNAGHLLGATSIEIHLGSKERDLRLFFSGDVGRYDAPLHSNPEPPTASDVMVVESTYGDRDHDPTPVGDRIAEAVLATIARKGTLLVPSFAVGRSQLVTLLLRQLTETGKIPEIPVHIDSPMAVDATRIYREHASDPTLDPSHSPDGFGRLLPRNVHLHRTVEDSKALNRLDGPRIIISASGMLTSGRVLHHLKRLVTEEKNGILLVGFQADGTRGRSMLGGAATVRIHGADHPVRARLYSIGGLSGHADRSELLRWLKSAPSPAGTIFITHGEPEASSAFARSLRSELRARVEVPNPGSRYEIPLPGEGPSKLGG